MAMGAQAPFSQLPAQVGRMATSMRWQQGPTQPHGLVVTEPHRRHPVVVCELLLPFHCICSCCRPMGGCGSVLCIPQKCIGSGSHLVGVCGPLLPSHRDDAPVWDVHRDVWDVHHRGPHTRSGGRSCVCAFMRWQQGPRTPNRWQQYTQPHGEAAAAHVPL